MDEALIGFRELSSLRGPSFSEFTRAFGMKGRSSTQSVYERLRERGYITPSPVEKGSYLMTPAGELRYRELIPDPNARVGPEWPIE